MLISNTSLYFTFNKDSVCQIRRGSIDLSSFQYKWLKFQKCYQEDSDYESFSVSLHLSSTNLIYSATVFKSQKVIFVPLNATDGTLVGNQYSLEVNCTSANSIMSDNQNIYILFDCTTSYIVAYSIYDSGLSISNSRFSVYEITSSAKFTSIILDSALTQVTMIGSKDSNGYLFQSKLSLSIALNTKMLDTPFNISSISNGYEITDSISLPTLTLSINQNSTYNGPTDSTNPLLNIPDQSNGSDIPSWIKFDEITSTLKFNTTGISSGSSVTLNIKSTIVEGNKLFTKTVSLLVVGCNVANCNQCLSTNSNSCSVCSDGYKLDNNSSIANNTCGIAHSASTETTSKAIVGAVAGISAAVSVCNLSAPQGLWMTLNQFQLILLLLLTNSQIPTKVVDYLSGMKSTTCSFNIIPFKDIPGISSLINLIDCPLNSSELNYFGLMSGSTLVNNFSLLCLLMIILCIQGIFLILYHKCRPSIVSKPKCSKFCDKLYQLFFFSINIRFLLEANQFMMICCVYEIKQFDTSSISKIVSIIISILFLIFCIILLLFSFVESFVKTDESNPDKHLYFKEFISGIKSSRKARLYSFVLLTRRYLFVTYLILGSSLSSIVLVAVMVIIQVAYFTFIVSIRPYEVVKNNAIEIINEAFFLLFLLILTYFNDKNIWSESSSLAFIYMILLNSMIIISIMILSQMISLIQWCRSKKRNNEVTPKPNNVKTMEQKQNKDKTKICKLEKDFKNKRESICSNDNQSELNLQSQDISIHNDRAGIRKKSDLEFWKNYRLNRIEAISKHSKLSREITTNDDC